MLLLDQLKALQHELGCKIGVLKAKELEAEVSSGLGNSISLLPKLVFLSFLIESLY